MEQSILTQTYKKFYSKNSIRMCINCRNKFMQKDLIRMSLKNDRLNFFSGEGRSFYICYDCLNDKKLQTSIKRISHTLDIKEQFKELIKVCQLSKK